MTLKSHFVMPPMQHLQISKTFLLILFVAMVVIGGFMGGCLRWQWTNFEWGNETVQQLWVTEVTGLSRHIAPGRLMPRSEPVQKSFNYGDPVRVQKSIVIRWKIGDDDHEQIFKREDIGLPKVLNGVTIRFTYQPDGKWRIEKGS